MYSRQKAKQIYNTSCISIAEHFFTEGYVNPALIRGSGIPNATKGYDLKPC